MQPARKNGRTAVARILFEAQPTVGFLLHCPRSRLSQPNRRIVKSPHFHKNLNSQLSETRSRLRPRASSRQQRNCYGAGGALAQRRWSGGSGLFCLWFLAAPAPEALAALTCSAVRPLQPNQPGTSQRSQRLSPLVFVRVFHLCSPCSESRSAQIPSQSPHRQAKSHNSRQTNSPPPPPSSLPRLAGWCLKRRTSLWRIDLACPALGALSKAAACRTPTRHLLAPRRPDAVPDFCVDL